MNRKKISAIINKSHLKSFFLKPYGLELLFILEEAEEEGLDNGIDDTWQQVASMRMQKTVFANYVKDLVELQSVTLRTSDFKKSKKILRLSREAAKELAEIRKTFPD